MDICIFANYSCSVNFPFSDFGKDFLWRKLNIFSTVELVRCYSNGVRFIAIYIIYSNDCFIHQVSIFMNCGYIRSFLIKLGI